MAVLIARKSRRKERASQMSDEAEAFWWRGTTAAVQRSMPCSSAVAHRVVQEGVPFAAFEEFMTVSGLPRSAVLAIADLSPRTLHRRKAEGRLTAIESDRFWRVTNLFRLAVELFEGSLTDAAEWFSSACRGLGGASPLAYAKTEAGAREVEQLIGRLEHGVLS